MFHTAGYRNGIFIVLAEAGRGICQVQTSDDDIWWYLTKDDARAAVYERIRPFL
jgi:hypothetical protein